MSQIVIQGNQPLLNVAFTNSAGAPTDPTTVTFKITDPTGAKTTYVYNTDAQLVKDSVGNYHVAWLFNLGGEWAYRFEGTGTVTAAAQSTIICQAARPS
jgi:hypothetical protein